MTDARAFLVLTRLTDDSRHAEYNAWHQLDHLPENLVLPGVAWGNRWVRTPACARASTVSDPELARSQYAVMYAFREPLGPSIQEWTDLNQRSIWWGRRPELPWTSRHPTGFLEPVKGYAAARTLVAPAAIPHRPHRGVHLTISEIVDGPSPATARLLRAYDRDTIPALLEIPGVSGVHTYRSGTVSATADAGPAGPLLLVRLAFLDEDPVATTHLIGDLVPSWTRGQEDGSSAERVLFSSPLESIAPWQWDWFDGSPADA